MNILLRFEEMENQNSPMLLGVGGNVEKVMMNKKKAVDMLRNLTALLQVRCSILV